MSDVVVSLLATLFVSACCGYLLTTWLDGCARDAYAERYAPLLRDCRSQRRHPVETASGSVVCVEPGGVIWEKKP